MVEYTLLLLMSVAVIAGLWAFIGSGYHKQVYEYYEKILSRSLEYEVFGNG